MDTIQCTMCNEETRDIAGGYKFYYGTTARTGSYPGPYITSRIVNGSSTGVVCYKCVSEYLVKSFKRSNLVLNMLLILALLSLIGIIISLFVLNPIGDDLVGDIFVVLLFIVITSGFAIGRYFNGKNLRKAKLIDKEYIDQRIAMKSHIGDGYSLIDNIAIGFHKPTLRKQGYNEFYNQKLFSDIFIDREKIK